jgi:hypothetical protein
MPLQGKLPGFVADRQQKCSWPGRAELPPDLKLPPQARIKAFRHEFGWDFRKDVWQEGPTGITFVYASAAGRGLEIQVL